jgi:hypothetical protein
MVRFKVRPRRGKPNSRFDLGHLYTYCLLLRLPLQTTSFRHAQRNSRPSSHASPHQETSEQQQSAVKLPRTCMLAWQTGQREESRRRVR